MFKSISLVGYKRLNDSGIKSIKIDFTGGLHLFIGSNGSGKTSLMEQLSVFPPSKDDFEIGGSKEIIWISSGKSIKLSAYFDTKPMFSFIVYGPNGSQSEMNENGSVGIQKDLVLDEFGVTGRLQSVIMRSTEASGFSGMSPSARREWISVVSDIDYEYAISVHKKIVALKKASKSICEYLSHKVMLESEGALSDSDAILNEQKSISLVSDISIIEDIKSACETALSKGDSVSLEEVSNNHRKAIRHLHIARAVMKSIPERYMSDQGPMLADAQVDYATTEAKRSVIMKAMAGTEEDIATIKNSESLSMSAINKEIDAATIELNAIDDIPIECVLVPGEHVSRLAGLAGKIGEIASLIPKESGPEFSLGLLRDSLKKLEKIRYELTTEKQVLNLAKQSLENRKTTTNHCPSCSHEWISDYDMAEINKLAQQVETSTSSVKSKIKAGFEASHAYKYLEAMQTVSDKFLALRNDNLDMIMPECSRLGLWDSVINSNVMEMSPSSRSNFFKEIRDASNASHRKESVSRRLSDLKVRMEGATDSGRPSTKALEDRLSVLKKDYSKALSERTKMESVVSTIKRSIRESDSMHNLADMYSSDIGAAQWKISEESIMDLISECNKDLEVMRVDLIDIELSMSKHKKIEIAVSGARADLEKEIERMDDLSVMERSINPKTGLIGQAIMSFVGSMTDKMNNMMGSVWDKPIVVFPPEIEDSGSSIDYRFPLSTTGLKSDSKTDVSKGSRSMREMVDMTFSVVASLMGAKQELPIFLDEFSSSMDDAHTSRSVNIVDKLVYDEGRQVFMATHNHIFYRSMAFVEITNLCSSNLDASDIGSDIMNRTTTIEMI